MLKSVDMTSNRVSNCVGETVTSRTLLICKPDAVERGLIGEIITRFERKSLAIVAAKLQVLDSDTLSRHYIEHQDKPFYQELLAFMTRGPALTAILEGPKDTWRVVRHMMGATNPCEASPGTIRGDFSCSLAENLVHGSDSAAAAQREIALFFPEFCTESET